MSASTRGGFGNGRFVRGRGRGGGKPGASRKHVRDADTNSSLVGKIHRPAMEPPAYYLEVRRVLQRVLHEHAASMGEHPLTMAQLLPSICAASDAVSWQEPMDAPLDKDTLHEKVQQCVEEAIRGNSSSTVKGEEAEGIVNVLTERLLTVVPKTVRPVEETEENNEGNGGEISDDPFAEIRPIKRRRDGKMELAPLLTSYKFGADTSSLTGNIQRTSVLGQNGILPIPSSSSLSFQQPQQPPPPSVFSESAVCPVRCVVFDNLPPKYYAMDAMKRQLDEMCSRVPGAYFLNLICLPGEGRAIVSFNSKETAACVMFTVNASTSGIASHNTSGNSVRVSPANEAQQQQLWGPLSEKTKAQEEMWADWLQKYKACLPSQIRGEWSAAMTKSAQHKEELASLTSAEAMGTLSEEQLKKKLQLLQGILECKRSLDKAEEQMRGLYGDTYKQHISTGPTEAKYSSSSAAASKPRQLIFIRDLPGKLDDDGVIAFFRMLGLQPVHIWRDPGQETTLCAELETIGHVFGILRQLDATSMCFGGATFSRERVG